MPVQEWQDLTRIARLMTPFDGNTDYSVPNTNFSYKLYIGKKIPTFTFVPGSMEIIHRLIMMSSQASMESLKLHKSQL